MFLGKLVDSLSRRRKRAEQSEEIEGQTQEIEGQTQETLFQRRKKIRTACF
jgi:hypothetical protein